MTKVRLVDVPLVRATGESLKGFGEIVRDPATHRVEIVPWPVQGHRTLDPGTGNEGGTTEGIFACEWRGNELRIAQLPADVTVDLSHSPKRAALNP